MGKPKRIGHLVLNVKDVEVSEKFYPGSPRLRDCRETPLWHLSDLWQHSSRYLPQIGQS
jgi:extradiol dioxygenase family protein